MRTALILFIFQSLCSIWVFSQDKIQWSFSFNSSRCLEAKAQIQPGWHIYSIHLQPEIGPVPTQISIDKNKAIQLTDPWIEIGEMIEHFDPTFGATVNYFEENYTVVAPLAVKKETTVNGELTYMLCDDKRCLPPKTISFQIEVTPFKP